MKVVALDCDGVLNHRALYAANELRRGQTTPPDWIDRACVARLNGLLARTGALVVISSSWRTYALIPGTTVGGWRGVAEVLTACGLAPGAVIDGTPDHRTELPVRARRWGEIRAWLDLHPEVTDYVVLDDLELDGVAASIRDRGYPPTLREILAATGHRSTNSASDHLRAIERKGYLTHEPGAARGLRLVDPPPAAPPG